MSKPKRLYRDTENQVIAGVCSGIAEYFSIDVVIVRVLSVVLLFTGVGFIGYIAAWIIVPPKPIATS
jgi:phage shock protein PspC (stress-responsive transcriptional regulator)